MRHEFPDRSGTPARPGSSPGLFSRGSASSARLPARIDRASSRYGPQGIDSAPEGRTWDIARRRPPSTETHRHFSRIARRYRDLRTTDLAPIESIERALGNERSVLGADAGCGAGRYDVELFGHLGADRLFLICIDSNERMLRELTRTLRDHAFSRFKTIRASAGALPLPANSLTAVFSFNAVHHFRLLDFLRECGRVLRPGGRTFIYTRFRSQNRRNIWGRFFPGFDEKENRLYERAQIQRAVEETRALRLESVEEFRFRRNMPLERLETLATQRHYSTFGLYESEEFREALEGFRRNLKQAFPETRPIRWVDENALLVIEKLPRRPAHRGALVHPH